MKRTGIKGTGVVLCTVISLFVLVGSSIWEGAAGVAVGGDFPETGLYIATNSFPLNTVVYITNLENGKTTRVVTSAALEAAPGLLAILSSDAAEAIGLPGRTLGRIRMTKPPDSVAFSRFGQRRPSLGDPDVGTAAFAALDTAAPSAAVAGTAPAVDEDLIIYLFPETIPDIGTSIETEPYIAPLLVEDSDILPEAEMRLVETPVVETPVENIPQGFHQGALSLMRGFFPEPSYAIIEDFFAPEPQEEPEILSDLELQETDFQQAQFHETNVQLAAIPQQHQTIIPEQVFQEQEIVEVEQEIQEPVIAGPGYILTLVPAEFRPPTEAALTPDPNFVIPGITPAPVNAYADFIDPALVIDPIREAPAVSVAPEPVQPVIPAFVPPPVFHVPLITNLQAGKYYVQIAAYSNAEAVREELSRIERIDATLTREVVVMRGVNPEHGTVYQILIGPLNLGESGALLRRFRSTHRDAFIRTGG